jgi:hypothetical protein
MKALHANPILTKDTIDKAVQSEPLIAGSDLGSQVELVKVSLQPLSLQELATVWSSLCHARYRTSVSYRATAVMI